MSETGEEMMSETVRASRVVGIRLKTRNLIAVDAMGGSRSAVVNELLDEALAARHAARVAELMDRIYGRSQA